MGTGLGLCITKEIVSKMKGEVRAFSRENKGSTFIICVPTYSPPPDIQQNIEDKTRLIEILKSKKIKAIVADDVQFNINLVNQYLQKIDCKLILSAQNGDSAYQQWVSNHLRNSPIDLVITDIDMPICDGKGLCQKIREYERLHNLKACAIIIISGNDNRAMWMSWSIQLGITRPTGF